MGFRRLLPLLLGLVVFWVILFRPNFIEEKQLTPVDEPPVTEIPPPEEEPEPPTYDFSQPVPLPDMEIPADYFTDAVFIGDSRTCGLQHFGGLDEATYLCGNGLNVRTVFSKPVLTIDGEKVTAMDALKKISFSKVYIAFGINELGWVYSDVFVDKYRELVGEITKLAPDAVIYVQSIMPVSQERSRKDEVFNNDNIAAYNQLLRQLAREEEIYYLDVATSVMDEEGCLPGDASSDGIHLNKKYCRQWVEYLKQYFIEE